MTRTLAQTLAEFAAARTLDELPPEVVHSAELRLLDTLGICLASQHFGLADGVAKMVDLWGGRPEAHPIGGGPACPAPNAALVNGTLAHSLDFDDTHLPSVLHPSASIFPAVLAMAEASGRSGAEALVAAVIGIEVTVRIGMAGYLPDAGNVFFERGWHATSICGTLGAAVAGARLLGLDADGILHSLGIAASFGAGVIEGNRAGGTVKRVSLLELGRDQEALLLVGRRVQANCRILHPHRTERLQRGVHRRAASLPLSPARSLFIGRPCCARPDASIDWVH